MSNIVEVYVIVEGLTEQTFVRDLLAPYLSLQRVFLFPILIGKPGHKGGNVNYDRAKTDIGTQLRQRGDTFVTTLIDYYGLKRWPGQDATGTLDAKIAALQEATISRLAQDFADQNIRDRFIPYFAVHEFEALLFSDVEILARRLHCSDKELNSILEACGEPERINDNPETAPSKRLNKLSESGKFRKTTTGIVVAKEIGILRMREKCPHFDNWISKLENLAS